MVECRRSSSPNEYPKYGTENDAENDMVNGGLQINQTNIKCTKSLNFCMSGQIQTNGIDFENIIDNAINFMWFEIYDENPIFWKYPVSPELFYHGTLKCLCNNHDK